MYINYILAHREKGTGISQTFALDCNNCHKRSQACSLKDISMFTYWLFQLSVIFEEEVEGCHENSNTNFAFLCLSLSSSGPSASSPRLLTKSLSLEPGPCPGDHDTPQRLCSDPGPLGPQHCNGTSEENGPQDAPPPPPKTRPPLPGPKPQGVTLGLIYVKGKLGQSEKCNHCFVCCWGYSSTKDV